MTIVVNYETEISRQLSKASRAVATTPLLITSETETDNDDYGKYFGPRRLCPVLSSASRVVMRRTPVSDINGHGTFNNLT